MEKVLVTTDFSGNSLSGLRFAIQLASQHDVELIFFHANDLWDDTVFRGPEQLDMMKRDRQRIQQELEALVASVYNEMNVKPGKYSCVCYYHIGIINSILHYASEHACSFICISTLGAGNMKLVGSITRELICESQVPVLCIPRQYEPQPVNDILYASDMHDYEAELKKVIEFARPLNAAILLLHIVNSGKALAGKQETESRLQKQFGHNISVIFEEKIPDTDFGENIDMAVWRYSASMLVMFTNQKRNLLEMLFSPSRTEKYSVRTKVPLLVYAKEK